MPAPEVERRTSRATRAAGVLTSWLERSDVLPPLAVLVVSWGVLELAHGPCRLHGDTMEDLLLARRCLDQQHCPEAGVSTSLEGVEQGALWVSLLAVLRAIPVSVDAIHSATFALASIGLALLFAWLRPRPSRVALATSALTCLGLVYGGEVHVLWNPSLTPLPAALLLVACLQSAERSELRVVVPLGLALGLTIESHPVAVLAAPGALLIAGMGAGTSAAAVLRPTLAGVLALALYLAHERARHP